MKIKLLLIFLSICIMSIYCGGSKNFVLEKAEQGKSILVGAILIENDGLDEIYQSITENITVVIAGKSIAGEEEGYRLKTDENGYFILQNVPPGSYVLKGFEVDIAFGRRMLINSRCDGNTQIYYPAETIIDYTVRVWPESMETKVLDMEINYFKVDQALRIATRKYKRMNNLAGVISGSQYTMANPLDYFRTKFPQSDWFESL